MMVSAQEPKLFPLHNCILATASALVSRSWSIKLLATMLNLALEGAKLTAGLSTTALVKQWATEATAITMVKSTSSVPELPFVGTTIEDKVIEFVLIGKVSGISTQLIAKPTAVPATNTAIANM